MDNSHRSILVAAFAGMAVSAHAQTSYHVNNTCGDNAWTGAEIAEIPDLSEMYVDLKLEEVDRGKLQMGQEVRIRVDAIPDKEFTAKLDWISPIAALVFKGGSTAEKTFPARATITNLDGRLRPGMSASTEVIIEKEPNVLLIPARASFSRAFQTRSLTPGAAK